MITNWMPIDVEMEHWVLAGHPMNPMQVRLDTVDMEVVFVELQLQQPDDNTYRQRMEVLQADLDLDTAKSLYMVDHHRVFEMQHNCLLQPAAPGQRQFVASIWFCKEENVFFKQKLLNYWLREIFDMFLKWYQ